MKQILILTLVLSLSKSEAVYANDTNGYVDQTAWRETLKPEQVVSDGEQVVLEPKYIETKLTVPPKVLTQKITAEPKIIQEQLVAPIQQKIITQPTILNKTIQAQPQFVYGENTVQQREPVIMPVRNTFEQQEKIVNVPNNTVEYKTFVQPTDHTIYEKINIVQAEDKKEELKPIYTNVNQQQRVIERDVAIPAATVYNQQIHQPIIDRENIKLNIKDSPEQYFDLETKVLPQKYEETTRIQQEMIPGRNVYSQQTIKPQLTTEHLEVTYQQNQPVYSNAPIKFNAPVTKTDSKTITKDRVFQIPEYSDVGVRVPIAHYIPEYHDVPLYIEMPPVKDIIQRNVKEILINPKDYITEVSDSESEEEVTCGNCIGQQCYYCQKRKTYGGKDDISSLFD